MVTLARYMQDRLAEGRAYFLRDEALAALGSSPEALSMALLRQSRKQQLASPRQGFHLILRPEDRAFGVPDPARWIDPLMRYLQIDYRIGLLRAAAFHGASHQASMVFQVIAPKQMRGIAIGRHRLEFIYQRPESFVEANRPLYLDTLKSDAGLANVAGVELTLLDCVRYVHKAGGIAAVAQIVKDLGGKARPITLARLAVHYENAAVRRLGYLLDALNHVRQADALRPFVKQAKSAALLDSSARPLIGDGLDGFDTAPEWQLVLNEPVEIDF